MNIPTLSRSFCTVVFAFPLAACGGEAEPGPRGSAALRMATGTDTGMDTDAEVCDAPVLDPRRSLIETNQTVLAPVGMRALLGRIASNAGLSSNPVATHDQLMDTYNDAAGATFGGAPHCDDELTGGAPSLNGYPLACPRAEGGQVGNIDSWFAIAAVNRLDLADAGGAHCGEQRIIMANDEPIGPGRMFVIFEAQIPNPEPGCADACRPIAEFWGSLSEEDDPNVRRQRLLQAFIIGNEPGLSAAGFGPFMTGENFTFGTGQVRTNNFDQFPWTLREFKFVAQPVGGSTLLTSVPVPVAANPHGELWNDNVVLPAGQACRDAFVSAVGGLMTDDPNTMALGVPVPCLAGESRDDIDADYPFHLAQASVSYRDEIQTAILDEDPLSALTPDDIAHRAQFAGACIGCHQQSNNADLGDGITAPPSLGFVHVHENLTENCGDGTTCFRISPAMTDSFLPFRQSVLQGVLETCPDACGTPSSDGSSGGGVSPLSVVNLDGFTRPDGSPDIDALLELDQRARDGLSEVTIGGRPSGATH